MQVKNIAECSKGSILQHFRPSLSYYLSLRSLFCLFLSGGLRQVLQKLVQFRGPHSKNGGYESSCFPVRKAPLLIHTNKVLFLCVHVSYNCISHFYPLVLLFPSFPDSQNVVRCMSKRKLCTWGQNYNASLKLTTTLVKY